MAGVELILLFRPAATHPPCEDAGKGASCPLVAKGRSALSHFKQIQKPLPKPPISLSCLLRVAGSRSFCWQCTSYKGF